MTRTSYSRISNSSIRREERPRPPWALLLISPLSGGDVVVGLVGRLRLEERLHPLGADRRAGAVRAGEVEGNLHVPLLAPVADDVVGKRGVRGDEALDDAARPHHVVGLAGAAAGVEHHVVLADLHKGGVV